VGQSAAPKRRVSICGGGEDGAPIRRSTQRHPHYREERRQPVGGEDLQEARMSQMADSAAVRPVDPRGTGEDCPAPVAPARPTR